MKILILGGDGYLGWPTAMFFADKGHEVKIIDNFVKLEKNHDVRFINKFLGLLAFEVLYRIFITKEMKEDMVLSM